MDERGECRAGKSEPSNWLTGESTQFMYQSEGRGDKMGGGVLLSVFLGMLAVGQGERC